MNCIREQNEILMSLLKRFYEKKQLKHPICKTEEAPKSRQTTSALDNFRQKAKKSLSTSFETILKVSLLCGANQNNRLFQKKWGQPSEKKKTSAPKSNAPQELRTCGVEEVEH